MTRHTKDSTHPDDQLVIEQAETIREHLPAGMTLAQWLSEGDLSSFDGHRYDAGKRAWVGMESVAYACGYLQASANDRRQTLLEMIDSIAPELTADLTPRIAAGDLVRCVHPKRGWTQAEVLEVLPAIGQVRVTAPELGEWWAMTVERIEP